ncbi:hypothetical protein LPJ73_008932, partial [Coemansia sp. RSA 2703]
YRMMRRLWLMLAMRRVFLLRLACRLLKSLILKRSSKRRLARVLLTPFMSSPSTMTRRQSGLARRRPSRSPSLWLQTLARNPISRPLAKLLTIRSLLIAQKTSMWSY